jgi:hypothetical protein
MGRAGKELAATTASMIAAALESHTRTLPTAGPDAAFSYARGWSLSRTTHDGPLRVDSVVRRVFVDGGANAVDDAESYTQLVGFANALVAAGFAVEEVFEGWRTVALDVVPALAPRKHEKHDKHDKKVKHGKHDKADKEVKGPKGAKGEKAAKTDKDDADDADDAGKVDERAEATEPAEPSEPGERSPEPEPAALGAGETAARDDGAGVEEDKQEVKQDAAVPATAAAPAAPTGPVKERRGLFRRPRPQEPGESAVPAGATTETPSSPSPSPSPSGADPQPAGSVEPAGAAEAAKEVETAAA